MTYDGGLSKNKRKVKIPNVQSLALSGASGYARYPHSEPCGVYFDSENIYFYSSNDARMWKASKKDPTDIYPLVSEIPDYYLNNVTKEPIGDHYYAFGCYDGATDYTAIYKAHKDTPTAWYYTGHDLPGTGNGAQLYVDNSNIYLYNTTDSSYGVYIAPISNPTAFTNAPVDTGLPPTLVMSCLVVVGTEMYLYGGKNIATGAWSRTVYSASTMDPLTWTAHTLVLPELSVNMFSYVDSSTIYLYGGGNTGGDRIYSAPISSPLTVSDISSLGFSTLTSRFPIYYDLNNIFIYTALGICYNPTSSPGSSFTINLINDSLPVAAAGAAVGVANNGVVVAVGGRSSGGANLAIVQVSASNISNKWTNASSINDVVYGGTMIKTSKYLYIIGGSALNSSNKYAIYKADLNTPTNWTLETNHYNAPRSNHGQALIIDNFLYYIGGETGAFVNVTNIIYRAVIENGEIIPDSWSTSIPSWDFDLFPGGVGGVGISRFNLILAGDYVWIFNGVTGRLLSNPVTKNTNIYMCSKDNFLAGSVYFHTLPYMNAAARIDAALAIINNTAYVIGGGTSTSFSDSSNQILAMSMSDLASGILPNLIWDSSNSNDVLYAMPTGGNIGASSVYAPSISGSSAVVVNDRLALIGGRTSSNGVSNIYRSNSFAEYNAISPDLPDTNNATPVIDPNTGAIGVLTKHQKSGMLPWLVTDF